MSDVAEPSPTSGPRRVWWTLDVVFLALGVAFVLMISALWLLFMYGLLQVAVGVRSAEGYNPGGWLLLYLPISLGYVVALALYLVYSWAGRLAKRSPSQPRWVGRWVQRLLMVYPVLVILLYGASVAYVSLFLQ